MQPHSSPHQDLYYLRYIPDSGWDVRKEGNAEALRRFANKIDAVEYATLLARQYNADLAVPEGEQRLLGLGKRNVSYLDPHRWDEDVNE